MSVTELDTLPGGKVCPNLFCQTALPLPKSLAARLLQHIVATFCPLPESLTTFYSHIFNKIHSGSLFTFQLWPHKGVETAAWVVCWLTATANLSHLYRIFNASLIPDFFQLALREIFIACPTLFTHFLFVFELHSNQKTCLKSVFKISYSPDVALQYSCNGNLLFLVFIVVKHRRESIFIMSWFIFHMMWVSLQTASN